MSYYHRASFCLSHWSCYYWVGEQRIHWTIGVNDGDGKLSAWRKGVHDTVKEMDEWTLGSFFKYGGMAPLCYGSRLELWVGEWFGYILGFTPWILVYGFMCVFRWCSRAGCFVNCDFILVCLFLSRRALLSLSSLMLFLICNPTSDVRCSAWTDTLIGTSRSLIRILSVTLTCYQLLSPTHYPQSLTTTPYFISPSRCTFPLHQTTQHNITSSNLVQCNPTSHATHIKP